MSIFFCLLLLLGVCRGFDETGSIQNVDARAKAHNLKAGEGIQRPCSNLDPDCVRKNLAERSLCTPITGGNKTLHVDYLELPLSHANISFIWEDAEMSGVDNWEITEFYIDRDTNQMVLEVLFDEITFKGDNTHVVVFLKGREPEVLTTYFSFTYLKSYITATVPYDPIYGLAWEKMYAFTYFEVDKTPYDAGSGLTTTDPEVQASLDEVLAKIGLGLKEVSLVFGKYIMKSFLQNYFCTL